MTLSPSNTNSGRFRISFAAVILGLLLIPPLAYAGYVFIAALLGPVFNPTPEIGRNLIDDVVAASQEFDRRVRHRFPIGSPEKDLISELRHEGYARWSNGKSDPLKWAAWDGPGQIVCSKTLVVSWQVDDHGAITQIDGRSDTTCL